MVRCRLLEQNTRDAEGALVGRPICQEINT